VKNYKKHIITCLCKAD